MKVIVNRDFNNFFTKIAVFSNGQLVKVCPASKDYCTFDAKDGDKIVVKLKHITVASFVYREGNEICCVSPTKLHKIWEWLNFTLFPYLTLVLFVFKSKVESVAYDWFCTGMIVLTVLSLIVLTHFELSPRQWERMYKSDIL